jgi:hypothetical protein
LDVVREHETRGVRGGGSDDGTAIGMRRMFVIEHEAGRRRRKKRRRYILYVPTTTSLLTIIDALPDMLVADGLSGAVVPLRASLRRTHLTIVVV